jgi:hypothetical protein
MTDDTCPTTGKQRHPSPQAAGKVADSILHRDRGKPKVYACHFCGGWHITGHTRNKRLILADKRKARDG